MKTGDESSPKIRTLLKTTPVDRSIPPWVRTAVESAIERGEMPKPDHRLISANVALDHATNVFGSDWLDHSGRLNLSDGTEALISEPYAEEIDHESLAQLARLCRALRFKYELDANSHHYPGRTIRIVIQQATEPSQVQLRFEVPRGG